MTRRFISLAPRLLVAAGCVTKPFSPRELLARLHAVLRRYQVQATLPERDHTRRAYRFAGWELNLRTRRLLSPEGHSVELSNGEFSLLNALCRAPQRVLTRDLAAVDVAPARGRGVRPHHRRANPPPAAQDRSRFGAPQADPDRTRRGLPAGLRRRYAVLSGPCWGARGMLGCWGNPTYEATKLARAHQGNL